MKGRARAFSNRTTGEVAESVHRNAVTEPYNEPGASQPACIGATRVVRRRSSQRRSGCGHGRGCRPSTNNPRWVDSLGGRGNTGIGAAQAGCRKAPRISRSGKALRRFHGGAWKPADCSWVPGGNRPTGQLSIFVISRRSNPNTRPDRRTCSQRRIGACWNRESRHGKRLAEAPRLSASTGAIPAGTSPSRPRTRFCSPPISPRRRMFSCSSSAMRTAHPPEASSSGKAEKLFRSAPTRCFRSTALSKRRLQR